MNELKIFENKEFGKVRIQEINGDAWLVGKDVCEVFGDTNYRRSLNNIDNDEKIISEVKTTGGIQNMILINESGLYTLLFNMQPKKAKGVSQNDTLVNERVKKLKQFKRWVTHDVIPTIRKHGAYLTDDKIEEVLNDPDTIIKLAMDLKEERKRRVELQKTLDTQRPKVLFADSVESSETSILIGDFAKILRQNGHKVGQNRLFKWLRENDYLIKSGERRNMPSQKSMELRLFEVKERTINNPDGSVRITKTTKITGIGQVYFINKF